MRLSQSGKDRAADKEQRNKKEAVPIEEVLPVLVGEPLRAEGIGALLVM